MRKVVAIGLSGLVVCSFAGAGYSSLTPGAAELSHQYTHLIETNQSQTCESLSQSALLAERTVSVSRGVKVASVSFIAGGKQLDFGNIDFEDPTIELCKKKAIPKPPARQGKIRELIVLTAVPISINAVTAAINMKKRLHLSQYHQRRQLRRPVYVLL